MTAEAVFIYLVLFFFGLIGNCFAAAIGNAAQGSDVWRSAVYGFWGGIVLGLFACLSFWVTQGIQGAA